MIFRKECINVSDCKYINMKKIMKKILIKVLYIFLLLILVFWIISFCRCELLTLRYKDEFADLYLQTGIISQIDRVKVISYSVNNAQVYYSSKNGSGNLLFFKKQSGEWTLERWETIWSKSGSADGFIWPYMR